MTNGRFITIEGPDGAGKSTQARLLVDRLERLGHAALYAYEPGGTELGAEIRELVLAPGAKWNLAQMAELFLLAADRAQHVKEVIRPALSKGMCVICDRYVDSSVAYQGAGLRGDWNVVRTVNRWATEGLMPELTLLLDVDADTGRLRRSGRKGRSERFDERDDRIERREGAFHERVREGYRRLAAEEPDRIVPIQAGGKEIDELHSDIWSIVIERFPQLGKRPTDVEHEGSVTP